MRSVTFILLFSIFASLPAKASLLIEPFINRQALLNENIDDLAYVYNNYGGRLGFQFSSIFFGGEYQAGSGETDYTGDSIGFVTEDIDDVVDTGAFLGFESGNIRIFGVYYFNHEATHTDTAVEKFEGDGGFKLSIGYKVMSHMTLSGQWMKRHYTKETTSNTDIDADLEGFSVEISFPFWLF